MSSHKDFQEKLGMSPGKAGSQLRKQLLFDLVQKLGKDTCLHCNQPIQSPNEFSIRHITPWLYSQNPTELYFNYKNIGFSHVLCSSVNKRQEIQRKHGIPLDELRKQHLGMPIGTARNRLVKLVLFHLAHELSMSDCYRCQEHIAEIEDFTIEHRTSWIDAKDPYDAYFNMSNISFSHLKCNIIKNRNSLSPLGKIPFKGVTYKPYNRIKRPYCASVFLNKEKRHIGYYATALEAAQAYDKVALQYHGERAVTNKMLGLLD